MGQLAENGTEMVFVRDYVLEEDADEEEGLSAGTLAGLGLGGVLLLCGVLFIVAAAFRWTRKGSLEDQKPSKRPVQRAWKADRTLLATEDDVTPPVTPSDTFSYPSLGSLSARGGQPLPLHRRRHRRKHSFWTRLRRSLSRQRLKTADTQASTHWDATTASASTHFPSTRSSTNFPSSDFSSTTNLSFTNFPSASLTSATLDELTQTTLRCPV